MEFEGTIERAVVGKKDESPNSHLELKVVVPVNENLDINQLIRKYFKTQVTFNLSELQQEMDLEPGKKEKKEKVKS